MIINPYHACEARYLVYMSYSTNIENRNTTKIFTAHERGLEAGLALHHQNCYVCMPHTPFLMPIKDRHLPTVQRDKKAFSGMSHSRRTRDESTAWHGTADR